MCNKGVNVTNPLIGHHSKTLKAVTYVTQPERADFYSEDYIYKLYVK